jgi:hypothetical protein
MKQTLKDKLIAEAIDFFKIASLLDDDEEDFEEDDFSFNDINFPNDEEGDDFSEEDDFSVDQGGDDFELENEEEDDFSMDQGEDDFGTEDDDFSEETESGNEGLIRTVRGAYLVYKRLTPNNNYEELWIYNLGNVKSQTRIRNAILSGTDVDPVSLNSPEGNQSATTYSKGNIQFLHIDGLPN